ncbi:MAG: Smr/MutS family protein, partial [Erysipelotrichaceae bacterium]|nr:Smr/MutS family protein [Erysipelotrichaceae bacterium]
QAVLEKLLDQNAWVMTSTHFDSIKAYGKSDPRILVSSMEIDPVTLTPTYRYIPGISGSSFAFAIARSLNMDAGVLERARQLQQQNESQVQKQLKHLEELQQQARAKQERFDKMIAQAHEIQKEAFEKKESVEKQKKRLDDQYRQELDDMLSKKEEEAESILKELRKSRGQMHENIARKARLDALRPEEERKGPLEKKDWAAGDYVRIEALNNHGEILEVKKKKALVLVNGKKISVSTDQLTSMKRPQVKRQASQKSDRSFAPFPMEVNLIGMRVEEAMNVLDRYLDQAIVHRLKNVRIIHGMGTGALRKAVWDDLKKRSTVKKYTAAGPSDGGLGATLVELY